MNPLTAATTVAHFASPLEKQLNDAEYRVTNAGELQWKRQDGSWESPYIHKVGDDFDIVNKHVERCMNSHLPMRRAIESTLKCLSRLEKDGFLDFGGWEWPEYLTDLDKELRQHFDRTHSGVSTQ